jgi:hypothetical protein
MPGAVNLPETRAWAEAERLGACDLELAQGESLRGHLVVEEKRREEIRGNIGRVAVYREELGPRQNGGGNNIRRTQPALLICPSLPKGVGAAPMAGSLSPAVGKLTDQLSMAWHLQWRHASGYINRAEFHENADIRGHCARVR